MLCALRVGVLEMANLYFVVLLAILVAFNWTSAQEPDSPNGPPGIIDPSTNGIPVWFHNAMKRSSSRDFMKRLGQEPGRLSTNERLHKRRDVIFTNLHRCSPDCDLHG